MLQDSYLRWAEVDLATVRDTKSYLAQLVTRQALNALRASARRREDYVGPWLPEPLLLDEHDASADVVLAESVSMAMLVVLETLSPDERAVFVLREVFGFDYDEIASARRQIRGDGAPDRRTAPASTCRRGASGSSPSTPQAIARSSPSSSSTAAATGDVDGLMAMLAPDVMWTADSGGKASAARRPVVGRGEGRQG